MGFKKSQAKLTLGSNLIDFDKYNFEWSYTEEAEKLTYLKIRISNLTKDTLADLKKGLPVTFDYGYDDNLSTAIIGTIEKTETDNGTVTTTTTIEVKAVSANPSQKVSKTYKNKPHSYIIRDLATMLGLRISKLDLKTDKDNPIGRVVYGNGIREIRDLVLDCGSEMVLNGDDIRIYTAGKKGVAYVINFETGMLREPTQSQQEKKEFDYTVEALSNAEIRRGDTLKIESSELKTFCEIVKMEVEDFVTRYYVKVLEVGA